MTTNINRVVLSVHEQFTFSVTLAACGSSPHAQCMAGSRLAASDGLVNSSESLLGEVGREFPGL